MQRAEALKQGLAGKGAGGKKAGGGGGSKEEEEESEDDDVEPEPLTEEQLAKAEVRGAKKRGSLRRVWPAPHTAPHTTTTRPTLVIGTARGARVARRSGVASLS